MRTYYGPYSERGGALWRITIRTGTGRQADKSSVVFATEGEAKAALEALRAAEEVIGVQAAIEDYLAWLGSEGRKSSTLTTHRYRLEGFFEPMLSVPLPDITSRQAEKLYEMYKVGRSPDTHQGGLFLVKSFFEWARKKRKLVQVNPFDDVDPSGRKSRGKPQLKKDDTRALYEWVLANALVDDRACAVLMALTLGLRAHEIVGRTRDHLDCDGTELMVTESKTRAGIRAVRLSPVLQKALARRSKLPQERLLPYKAPWVRIATQWCCAQAGVAPVCAQSLRGMYATALLTEGIDPQAVARSLGHTNVSMTRSAYAAAGSEQSSRAAQVTASLEKKESTAGTDVVRSVPAKRTPITGFTN